MARASRTFRDACDMANPRWPGKRSRHSRRMRNPQLCVSGKRPMTWQDVIITVFSRCSLRSECLNSERFLDWLPYREAQCTCVIPDQVQITPNSVSRVSILRSMDLQASYGKLMTKFSLTACTHFSVNIHLRYCGHERKLVCHSCKVACKVNLNLPW